MLDNLAPSAGPPAADNAVAGIAPSSGTVQKSQIVRLHQPVNVFQNAHNALVREVTYYLGAMEAKPVKDVAENLRLIRSDVNTLLESFGQPASIVEGIESRFDRVHPRLYTFEQTIVAAPATVAELESVSERAERNRPRKNHKKTEIEKRGTCPLIIDFVRFLTDRFG